MYQPRTLRCLPPSGLVWLVIWTRTPVLAPVIRFILSEQREQ